MSVQIGMFGQTGSGKTCYMLGMSQRMALGFRSFQFTASEENQYFLLENAWREITLKGKLPEATNAKLDDIEFGCSYDFHPIANFIWRDYPGGYMDDPEEFHNLRKAALSSSCAMIVLPANVIKSDMNSGMAASEAADQYRQLRSRINRLLSELRKHTAETGNVIPLVWTITKIDLCPQENRESDFIWMVSKLKDDFSVLFKENEGWMSMVTAVSLGEHLGVSRNNSNLISSNAVIKPLNMHLPVLFAIRSYLTSELGEKRNRKQNLDNDLDYYRQSARQEDARGISKLWRGDVRERISKRISEIKGSMSMVDTDIDKLVEDIRLIAEEIKMAPYTNIYNNGKLLAGRE